jgi:hypothetical protein
MTSLFQSYPLQRLKSIFSDKKTTRFAITAAAGAFIGSVIGYQLGGGPASSFIGGIFSVSAWDACVGIGIGSAIAWVQSAYLRNTASRNRNVIRTGLRCALGGAAGGVGLVLTKSMLGGGFGHVVGWTMEGLVMGWLLAPVFPNMPRKPAAIGGLLAGFLGGVIGPILWPMFGTALGIAVADSLKGLFLAAMLTITEKFQAISDGFLIVHWGPKEQSTILLGEDPIAIGSDPKCQIYLKRENETHPPIVAEIVQAGGKTVLHDRKNNKTTDLPDGTVVNIGTLKIEVRAGIHQSALQKAQKS